MPTLFLGQGALRVGAAIARSWLRRGTAGASEPTRVPDGPWGSDGVIFCSNNYGELSRAREWLSLRSQGSSSRRVRLPPEEGASPGAVSIPSTIFMCYDPAFLAARSLSSSGASGAGSPFPVARGERRTLGLALDLIGRPGENAGGGDGEGPERREGGEGDGANGRARPRRKPGRESCADPAREPSLFSPYDLPEVFANWRDFPSKNILLVGSERQDDGWGEAREHPLIDALLAATRELLRARSALLPWLRVVCDPCDQICGSLARFLRVLRAVGGILPCVYLLQRPWPLVSLVDMANEALVSAVCLQRARLVIYVPCPREPAEAPQGQRGGAGPAGAEEARKAERGRLLLDGFPWPPSEFTLSLLQALAPALQLSFVEQASSFAAAGGWAAPASGGASVAALLSQQVAGLPGGGVAHLSSRDLEKAHSALLARHRALGGGSGDLLFCCPAPAALEADLAREVARLLESTRRAPQAGVSSSFIVIRTEDDAGTAAGSQRILPVMLCLAASSLVPDWLRFLADSMIAALEAGVFTHPKRRLLEASAQFLRTLSLRQEANLLSARGRKGARAPPAAPQ